MYITNISYDGVYHCYGDRGVIDISAGVFDELKELWYDNNGGYVSRNGYKIWSFSVMQFVEYLDGEVVI